MEKPLFIPLRREYFEAFKAGDKIEEFRPEGPRWNARTCRIGRPVVLSLGYGKGERLAGRVAGYSARKEPTQTDAWRRVLVHYRVEIDVAPLDRLAGALARGELISQELVAECQATVTALKRAYRRMDGPTVKSLCNTTSIEILLADTPNTERKAA